MKDVLKGYRTASLIFIATFFMLIYVNQQVLIYQMGLNIKENHQVYSKLVDHNKILIYNVLNLKSPANLQTKLLDKKVEMDMPHKWQVVKLESSPEKFVRKEAIKRGLFANLFVIGREAEASPNINSLVPLNF